MSFVFYEKVFKKHPDIKKMEVGNKNWRDNLFSFFSLGWSPRASRNAIVWMNEYLLVNEIETMLTKEFLSR